MNPAQQDNVPMVDDGESSSWILRQGVLLREGDVSVPGVVKLSDFNILLTLLGYVTGIIHAVWIIARR